MELVPRYDEDYFNCLTAHVLSYLSMRDVPVEWMFYHTYDNTRSLYNHFIVNQRDRWKFETPASQQEEVAWFGVRFELFEAETFEEALPHIVQKTDEGKLVFIIADAYYVPHRIYAYNRVHDHHSFMISGYRQAEQGLQLFVQDSNFYEYVDAAHLGAAYDAEEGKFNFTIEIDRSLQEQFDPQRIQERYHKWIEGLDDDFTIFDTILELFEEGKSLESERKTIENLIHYFFYIASSRKLFLRFLELGEEDTEIRSLTRDAIAHASAVQTLLEQFRTQRTVNRRSVRQKIGLLQQTERGLYGRLKQKVRQPQI